MPIILNGTTGITTPGITNTGPFTFQGVVELPAGAVGAPSLTTTGDTNTGIYFPAANQVAIATDGAQRVFIGATGDVGIGTGSPGAKLDVSGTVRASDYFRFSSNGANPADATASFYDQSTVGPTISGLNVAFRTGSSPSERFRIDNAGNVGVNVTPSAWNTVFRVIEGGSATTQSWIGFQTNSSHTKWGANSFYDSGTSYRYKFNGPASYANQSEGTHSWHTASSGTAGNIISFVQAMTLDASGNLSLGFTGGATRLGVRGPMYVPAAGFKELGSFFGTDSQATGNGGGITLGGVYSGTNVTAFAQVAGLKENSTDNNYAGYLAFYSRPNGDTLIERARITSDGNLGVGTTSPGEKLQVAGNIKLTGTNITSAPSTTTQPAYFLSTNGGGNFFVGIDSSTGGSFGAGAYGRILYSGGAYPMVFYTNDTERARITSAGNFGINTTAATEKLEVASGSIFVNGESVGVVVDSANKRIGLMKYPGHEAVIARVANQDFGICRVGGSNIFDGSSLTYDLTVATDGSVSVAGALSKGSGSFRIDHPLKPDTHQLVHSFIEGPQADLIYRGKATLMNGQAVVNIDAASGMSEGTFVALCREVQCFTSNESDWDAVRGSVTGNLLTIECQNPNSSATVSWMVVGERQDKHMYDTGWTDENGKVIVEPLKELH